MTEETVSSDRLTLHYVGGSAQQRAHFAQTAMLLGHHCELYDDLHELAIHPPRRGLIFLQDEPEAGGIVAGIERLEKIGVWLPVIAIGVAPGPHQIVDSIKAGAMDYIVLPLETERLQRCLARNTLEAERNAASRRKKVEAQERLGRLSPREAEVLELLTNGCSNKLMARQLGISPRTVEIHRANMLSKIGVPNSASALRLKLEADGR